jgi:uncharacterized protein (TIGR00730 family)
MPTKKKPLNMNVRQSKRKLSDEGARRLAESVSLNKRKRFHHWMNKTDATSPPTEQSSNEFTESANWRIFRIMAEFIEGFQFLDKLHGEVSVFGSARITPEHEYYQEAKKLGRLLAKDGYTVITGGGPGIMEAANWGAFDAGGVSVGLDIELPTDQRRNQFVNKALGFHYFFTRKVMMSASAQAYVFMPGGFGTLDEMTEMVTLIQTGKIPSDVPIILYGEKFWKPFMEWVENTLLDENRFLTKEELAIIQLVDTPEEAMRIIKKTFERPYGSETLKTMRRGQKNVSWCKP